MNTKIESKLLLTTTALLLGALLSPSATLAQEAPPLWWLQSAQAVQPRPEQLLIHAEAQYSYTRMRGNFSGSQQAGGGLLVLRKGLFSSGTSGNLQKQNASILGGRGSIEQETFLIEQNFRYDLLPKVGPQVGVLLERDESRYIDTHSIYYAGLKIHPLTTQRIQSRMLLAAGHQIERYTVPEPDRDAWHGYVSSEAHYNLTPKVRFYQNSSLMVEFSDFGNYRARATLGSDISLNRWFGVALNWNVVYDAEPVPSFAAKKDTQQMIMLRVMY